MKIFTNIQIIGCIIIICLLSHNLVAQTVAINEVIASNSSGFQDEDGDFEDWIELYNYGTQAINLKDYGLSDNSSNPLKWQFPDYTLQPGEFVTVFASGKNRKFGGDYNTEWFKEFESIAGLWLFDEEGTSTITDSSPNNNHGTIQGAQRVAWDDFGGALKFDRSNNDVVTIPNDPSLQIVGSMTISMWVNPSSFPGRQNPWNKSYGGEGTITVESDGTMRFYWGTAGRDAHPYQSFNSREALSLNQWSHIALVRDLENMVMKWYINGREVASTIPAFSAAVASSNNLRIGRGYSGTFEGMITKTMLLPYAATDEQIKNLYLTFYGNLHTNFSIKGQGEEVLLSNPQGSIIDLLPPTYISNNVSYGRVPDGTGEWKFFVTPTPGSSNIGTTFSEILQPPVFSADGGFYSSPFSVSLTHSDNDVQIFYTLDGSVPDENNLGGTTYAYKNSYPQNPGDPVGDLLYNSFNSHIYTAPIPIYDRSSEPDKITQISSTWHSEARYFPRSPVKKGIVIRAKAVKEGAISSYIASNTYFITPDGANPYTLPVISLAVSEDKLFDYETGIYVAGKLYDEWREANPETDISGSAEANYRLRGEEFEVEAHMQLFDKHASSSTISQLMGFRLHGGISRARPTKSLRLYARERYGKSTFDYPFFANRPHDSYKRLLLRNSGNDENVTFFRDAAVQKMVENLSFDTQSYQPSIIFINGEYWGMLNIRERFDKYYFQRMYDVEVDKVDMLSRNALIEEGDAIHFLAMRNYLADNDMSQPEHYAYIHTQMDIDNFIDYQITQIFIRNTDWPGNNIYFWRYKTPYNPGAPIGKDGRWRWILYDTDHGFGYSGSSTAYEDNTLTRAIISPEREWSTIILNRLLQNETFKNKFINRFADLMNSTFLPERMISVIDQTKEGIEAEMPGHIHRWNRWSSMDAWESRINVMRIFANERPHFQRMHIREHFEITGPDVEIQLDVDNTQHGYIRINSLALKPENIGAYPWTGQYFNNIPIEIQAIAHPGYKFSHWEGTTYNTALLNITPVESLTLIAHFVESATPEIVHYWHFNTLESRTDKIYPDFTIPGKAFITYPGTGDGYMDERKHREADPVSNLNLSLGQSVNQGAVLRVRNPSNTRDLIINAPTTGFHDISVAYATTRTTNGAHSQAISYSTDAGNNWHSLEGPYQILPLSPETENNGWQIKQFNIAHHLPINNNPDVLFKISFLGDGTINSNGNNRFDNITILGTRSMGSIPYKLVFLPVNNGKPITVNQPFSVSIQILDAGDLITNLAEGKQVTLTLSNGSGSLLGSTSLFVESGKNLVTFNNLTYDKVENGIRLQVSAPDLEGALSENFNIISEFVTVTDPEISEFNIFPNPANEFINIESVNTLSSISIYDVSGRGVYYREGLNTQEYTISLKLLDTGFYFIRLENETHSHVHKFQIIK